MACIAVTALSRRSLAGQTGFSEADLALLMESAGADVRAGPLGDARPDVGTRAYVFKHASALGNAPPTASMRVKVTRNPGVVRSFADFIVTPPTAADLPPGVELLTFDCDSFADSADDRAG